METADSDFDALESLGTKPEPNFRLCGAAIVFDGLQRYEFAADYAFTHRPRNAELFPFRDGFCRIGQWRRSAW
jgi:hypothetical protein